MNTEKPEPPEGYRHHNPDLHLLPEDALIKHKLFKDDTWDLADRRGEFVNAGYFDQWWVATRTPIPSPEHNPDGLTPEQYGAPEWRLLYKNERVERHDMWWNMNYWERAKGTIGHLVNGVMTSSRTYRRRVTPIPATEGEKGDKLQKGGDEPCATNIEANAPATQSNQDTAIPGAHNTVVASNAPVDVRPVDQGQAPPAAQGEKDAEIARLREELNSLRFKYEHDTRILLFTEKVSDLATVCAESAAKSEEIAKQSAIIEGLKGALKKVSEQDDRKSGFDYLIHQVTMDEVKAALARAEEAEKKGASRE